MERQCLEIDSLRNAYLVVFLRFIYAGLSICAYRRTAKVSVAAAFVDLTESLQYFNCLLINTKIKIF